MSSRRACTAWALRCAAHERPVRHERAAVQWCSHRWSLFFTPSPTWARIHPPITRRSDPSTRGWPFLSRCWWPVTAVGAVGVRGAIRGLARAPAALGAARSRLRTRRQLFSQLFALSRLRVALDRWEASGLLGRERGARRTCCREVVGWTLSKSSLKKLPVPAIISRRVCTCVGVSRCVRRAHF